MQRSTPRIECVLLVGRARGILGPRVFPPPASFYGRPINATERGNADGGFSCRQSPALPGTHTLRDIEGRKWDLHPSRIRGFPITLLSPSSSSLEAREGSHTLTLLLFRLPFSSFSSTPDPPPTTALFLLLPFLPFSNVREDPGRDFRK